MRKRMVQLMDADGREQFFIDPDAIFALRVQEHQPYRLRQRGGACQSDRGWRMIGIRKDEIESMAKRLKAAAEEMRAAPISNVHCKSFWLLFDAAKQATNAILEYWPDDFPSVIDRNSKPVKGGQHDDER